MMNLSHKKAAQEDVERIFLLCRELIEAYEDLQSIDYPKVIQWVRRKIETEIDDYTAVFVDGQKAGYYHFFQNEDGVFEIDDLYVLPPFQNRGIGSEIVKKCCAEAKAPVMLYVFVKNERAVKLYQRLGFRIVETVHSTRYIMRK